jgi:hypothetical protein
MVVEIASGTAAGNWVRTAPPESRVTLRVAPPSSVAEATSPRRPGTVSRPSAGQAKTCR